MNEFDNHKIMPRYFAIAFVMTLIGVAIIFKAFYIMTAQHDRWMRLSNEMKNDSLKVEPVRGNILSCDGQLMASTLPEYKIYMDFSAGLTEKPEDFQKDRKMKAKKDSLWRTKIDSISIGLSRILKEKSPAYFKRYLEEGHRKMSKNWAIWPKRIDYNTYSEIKQLPIFRLPPYKGGFHYDVFNSRKRPFGSLAQRTVGDMFGAKDSARCGLELSYDSILRGVNGYRHLARVMNKNLSIVDKAPIDGADIVTTIDVSMQDLAERSLIDELKEINGNGGVALVMEVETGDVKAIVNMTKCEDGEYREIKNDAVSDLLEPGSVFKTASIMVALEDGVVDTTYTVDTGNGVWGMYGREMKDHNWRRGGYQVLTLPQTLWYSSNIGVSRIIDDHYRNNPEKFVEGIYRLGLATDLKIPLVGSTKPHIRFPEKNKRGEYTNWSRTALPWMSIGYETQIPAISTLTFYNAIANNGRMMRPRFVKKVMKGNEVLAEFPPEVIKPHICKDRTLREIQRILEEVVSVGLGKKAGSKAFKVSGKTGTAQVAGKGGYKAGVVNYLLSFAGYFPSDNPQYSCIVCIRKSGLPASGGGMSGAVFHKIAEGIMAKHIKRIASDARDSNAIMVPDVKNGNILSASYILKQLGVPTNANWNGSYANGNPIWGSASHDNRRVIIKKINASSKEAPNVVGMGARDAVFLLESNGLKVSLSGSGKVISQSYPAGKVIMKGCKCQLILK